MKFTTAHDRWIMVFDAWSEPHAIPAFRFFVGGRSWSRSVVSLLPALRKKSGGTVEPPVFTTAEDSRFPVYASPGDRILRDRTTDGGKTWTATGR